MPTPRPIKMIYPGWIPTTRNIPELGEKINTAWRKAVPIVEERTPAAHAAYYRASLITYGLDPVPAIFDEHGDCLICGESGRCAGWHYEGERLPYGEIYRPA